MSKTHHNVVDKKLMSIQWMISVIAYFIFSIGANTSYFYLAQKHNNLASVLYKPTNLMSTLCDSPQKFSWGRYLKFAGAQGALSTCVVNYINISICSKYIIFTKRASKTQSKEVWKAILTQAQLSAELQWKYNFIFLVSIHSCIHDCKCVQSIELIVSPFSVI